MKPTYLVCTSLSHARVARAFLGWPTFTVVWTVYDSLDTAVRALSPMAQPRRRSAVARYHDPSSSRLRFLLLAKV